MIKIIIDYPEKLPGNYSCFITFPYNEQIINCIKQSQIYIYDKITKIWEIDLTSLSYFIDNVITLDNIEITSLIPEIIETSNVSIDNFNFKTCPFDYQLEGIKYGLNHNKWLLLDAPGLGKTLQIIYIAQQLKLKELIQHCLIVCGINTLKYNWKKEIEKHSDLSCMILGDKITSKGNRVNQSIDYRLKQLSNDINEFFIITNIETLRDDRIIKQLNKGKNKIDMIVVDEIHTCKSPTSQQGKNLLKLKNAKYKIGLTGTVIMNSPVDAYMPLKWIGKEHSNFSTFKKYYFQYGGLFNNEIIGYKNINVLKDELSQVSLRRTKELLDLPEKNIIHEIIDLNIEQKQLYNEIIQGIYDNLDKIDLDSDQVLSMVQRLRQVTSCPSILTNLKIESSKIQRTVDLCDQIIYNNDKVVVFSIFKETLRQLFLKLVNFSPLLCTGDQSDEEIADNIEKFQNDNNYKIMLCTPQKMGTGVTLTSASYMIFIDCPWTSAQCEQCEDRIHRIGSNKSVFIYYLWNAETFDLNVKQIVEDKSLLEDYIVDNKINQNLVSRLKKLIVDGNFS